MRQMPGGQWVAFEGYDKVHEHSNQPTEKKSISNKGSFKNQSTNKHDNSPILNKNSEDFLSNIEIPNISISRVDQIKQLPENNVSSTIEPIRNLHEKQQKENIRQVQNNYPKYQRTILKEYNHTTRDLKPIIIIFFPVILIILIVLCSLTSTSPNKSSYSSSKNTQPTLVNNRGVNTSQSKLATPTRKLTRACVNVNSLRIRGGPGTHYGIVGGLIYGDCVFVDKKSNDNLWYHIANGTITGWIYAEYVSIKN